MFLMPPGSLSSFSPLSLFLCVSFFPSAFSSSSTHFLWVSSPPPPCFHLLKRSATKLTCNYTTSEITPTLTAALLSIKVNTPVKLMGEGGIHASHKQVVSNLRWENGSFSGILRSGSSLGGVERQDSFPAA